MVLIGLWVAVVFVFGYFGGWIAEQKHREYGEGVLLGGLFGPLGCLIEAVLPTGKPPAPVSTSPAPAPASVSKRHCVQCNVVDVSHLSMYRTMCDGCVRQCQDDAAAAQREADEQVRQKVAAMKALAQQQRADRAQRKAAQRAQTIAANGGYSDWQLVLMGVGMTVIPTGLVLLCWVCMR